MHAHRLRYITAASILFLFCAAAGASENLLANPSFEKVDGRGMPEQWKLFVMPMEGALGRLDDRAADGRYAAMLRNPRPYADEPSNNWSQSLIEDVGNAELVLTGQIKADSAAEAAIWLQCWAKGPPRVIAAATTSADNPVYGTTDWTEVRTTVRVPANTDFIVVRCVLQGDGSAWFDDVSLRENIEDEEEEPVSDEPATETEETSNEESAAQDSSTPKPANDSEAMLEAMKELRETNAALREQLDSIRAEMEAVRQRLESSIQQPERPTVPRPQLRRPEGISPSGNAARDSEPKRVPPLVPRGYYDEKPRNP